MSDGVAVGLVLYLLVAGVFSYALSEEWDWRFALVIGLLWFPLALVAIFRFVRLRVQ